MSLSENRLSAYTEEILKGIYEEGRTPNPGEVAHLLREFTKDRNLETPEFEAYTMEPGTKFDVDKFNWAVQTITNDIETLHNESISITQKLLKQLSIQDASFKSSSFALKQVQGQLEDLLLTHEGGGAVLMSVYDDFTDLSKVDNDHTNATVDLESTSVTLEENGAASKRIRLPKLANLNNLRAKLLNPPGRVVNWHGPVAGSKAKGMAFDTMDAWQYQVLIRQELTPEVSIQIDIELTDDDQMEPSFSRLDVSPLTMGPMNVDILYSRDKVNWLRLPGYEQIRMDNVTQSLRFRSIRAQYLRFVLTKVKPDGEIDTGVVQNLYHFGISSIALYQMGYTTVSQLQSKALSPDVDGEYYLGRASLFVDEELPEGTDIRYEIAAGTGTGTLTGTDPVWSEVSPEGRDIPGVPRIVDFGGVQYTEWADHEFTITGSGLTAATGIGGQPLFNIGNVNAQTGVRIPGGGQLRMGVQGWHHIQGAGKIQPPKRQMVNNLFFGPGPENMVQKLYVNVTDEEPPLIDAGTIQVDPLESTQIITIPYTGSFDLPAGDPTGVLSYSADATPGTICTANSSLAGGALPIVTLTSDCGNPADNYSFTGVNTTTNVSVPIAPTANG